VRSINSALTTAQKQPSRQPYIVCQVKNQLENVRRLDYANVNTTSNNNGKHDCAADEDNNVHRVRMDGGAVKYNRVLAADTGTSSAYDSWTDLATGRGTLCAIAARGDRVIVLYTAAGDGTIYYRESTDNGASFGSETTLAAPGFTIDLAVAYKNAAGDAFAAWVHAASMRGIKRSGGSWGSVLNPGDAFSSLNGIALTYAFDYEMVITGQENATTKPTVWSRVYGDGSAVTLDTWGSLQKVVQAEAGQATFQSPFLDYVDTWRASYVEISGWNGGETRHYRTWLDQSNLFTAGPFAWRTPLPSDNQNTQGIAIAHTATHVYESFLTFVRRASWAPVTLDVSADLLALEISEEPLDCAGWIELANADSYVPDTSPAPALTAPIDIGNLVELSFGYYTSSGNLASRIQDLWITAIELRVEPHRTRQEPRQRPKQRSVLRLYVEGGLRRLQRSHQRHHIAYNASEDWRSILSTLMLRAGLTLSVTTASSRSDTILPVFHIAPDHSGHRALREALSFLADRIVPKADSLMALHETDSTPATDYTLGTDHPIYRYRARIEPPPVSETVVITHSNTNAYTTGQTMDSAWRQHGLGTIERIRDLTSDASAEASDTALAHHRGRALDREFGELVCPPVCGLELYDVLAATLAPIDGLGQSQQRVRSITWRYDQPRAIYEQQIGLCAI
jgi:hypothetical protein